jgi:hypothetical protein
MNDNEVQVNNPLALVVLAVPRSTRCAYEMATTMRERGKDQSIKLSTARCIRLSRHCSIMGPSSRGDQRGQRRNAVMADWTPDAAGLIDG